MTGGSVVRNLKVQLRVGCVDFNSVYVSLRWSLFFVGVDKLNLLGVKLKLFGVEVRVKKFVNT